MWTLYHLGWLVYDLAHLGRPWSWFFIAMSVLWFVRWTLPRRR